ncbi:MAG: hypothetical protein JWO31_727, partial [Phycisphaerales bacterium]|nr:hypothetical protein [Phycisphaerales bacterium]
MLGRRLARRRVGHPLEHPAGDDHVVAVEREAERAGQARVEA